MTKTTTPEPQLPLLPPPDLDVLLFRGSHDLPSTAAVALLHAHGVWLHSPEFRTAAITMWPATRPTDAPVLATIDFEVAAIVADTVVCSPADRKVLLVACSLGGVDVDNLAHLCDGLDDTTLARVLDAIAHAAGWHTRRVGHHVTGWMGHLPTRDHPDTVDRANGVRVPTAAAGGRPFGVDEVDYTTPAARSLRGLAKVLHRAAVQAVYDFGHPAAAHAWLAGYEQRCNVSELGVVAAVRRTLPDGPQ